MGLDKMSLGVEHGNYQFRKKYIDRQMPNYVVTDAMNLLYDMGVRTTCNNIIGFPYETRKLAFDTIKLNKTFRATDRTVQAFTPFHGTPLKKLTDQLGFTKSTDIQRSFVTVGSQMDMPQFRKKEINGLVKTFNMYCRFPESRSPAEKSRFRWRMVCRRSPRVTPAAASWLGSIRICTCRSDPPTTAT